MSEATIALTVMTGLLLLSFLGFLIWGICSGQFLGIEDAKYQIFRNSKNSNNPDSESEGKTSEGRGGDNQ